MTVSEILDHGSFDVTFLGHPEARNAEELWAGKTNVKERRKLQNRLNRRAFRKRQAEQKLALKHSTGEADGELAVKRLRGPRLPGIRVFALDSEKTQPFKGTISLGALASVAGISALKSLAVQTQSQSSKRHLRLLESWCRKFEQTMQTTGGGDVQSDSATGPEASSDAVRFEEGLIISGNFQYHTSIPGPEDQLINLMYYNVFRGLSKNIRALNLDIPLMLTWEYDSPYVTGKVDASKLAPDFQPTYLQRTVSHHPCFDIFPDPVVRDNAIVHWYLEKHPLEYRLCMALAGRHTWNETDLGVKTGCVLWGEPDVVESWEVTEGFAREWPFLVKNAVRLEAATNLYRAIRGEPPIFFA